MRDKVLARCRSILACDEAMPSNYSAEQKNYDKSWLQRLGKIMSYIESGERNISEIFARYRNYWMGGRWQVGEMADFVSGGESIRVLARSGYVFYRNAVADAVIAESQSNTKMVVELGSGLGESLFTIWLEGRLRQPTYHACEISPSGRKTSRVLASLDPRMKLQTHFFDYRRPCFEGIQSVSGHALVLSTHSIEQVDTVPAQLVESICDLASEVTALHFEPIGWQFTEKQDDPHVSAHRQRCIEKGYNQNFWSILKDFESKGLISLVSAEPYFLGFAYNPSCKLVWRKN